MSRGFGLLAIGLLLMIIVPVCSYAVQWYTAEPIGQLQARKQIQSGPNRIAQYNKFHNECGSIRALELNIQHAMAQLEQTHNKIDRQRILDNIAGMRGLRSEAIEKYNADASKEYTDGQFRSSDLPYRISQEGKTICENVY